MHRNLIAKLANIVKSTDSFNSFFAACQAEFEQDEGATQNEIERLRGELDDARFAVRQWDAKFEKGRLSEDEHEEKTRPHVDRIKAIESMLIEVEAKDRRAPKRDVMLATFKSVIRSWEGYEKQTPPGRPAQKMLMQALAASFSLDIVVYHDCQVDIRPRSEPPTQHTDAHPSQAT